MPVHKNTLKQTFLELIRINSPYPNDTSVLDYILRRCSQTKITALRDDFGNLIAQLPGDSSKPPIMLSTHVDIPEDTPKVAYRETAKGDIEGIGQTILGADPKTGLAALLELLLLLAAEDPDHHAPVDFVFTRGEEPGLLGAEALDMSKVRARRGLVIDEDGPVSVVVTQAPGKVQFEGTFIGRTAHPRVPELGVNAIQIAAQAIVQAPLGYTDATKQVIWNLGLLKGGTAVNTIPGSAYFLAEMRSFDAAILKSESERIYEVFAKAAHRAGGSLQAELRTLYKPYVLAADEPLILGINTMLDQLSLKPTYIKTFGASDANIFNARGIRCAAIGSGYYNAHQYIERADFDDMATLADFLERFVRA